ncbi:HAD family phosphatase [Candidatus Woesearchaeota archaeon]|nr:HAD family phosphatase [Candidatus Woesearchaeota archaeon]
MGGRNRLFSRHNHRTIRGVLLDMDGVLVDTEPLHCQAYIQAFRRMGYTVREDDYYDHWTNRGGGVEDFIEKRQLPILKDDIPPLKEEKRKAYRELLSNRGSAIVFDGIEERLIDFTQRFEGKVGLVTNSRREDVDYVLDITGLRGYFSSVITKDDVSRPKPDPEPYRAGGIALGLKPDRIVAIEDAEKGVISAWAAGMYVIGIPTEHTNLTPDFTHKAHLIVRSINDVSYRTLLRLPHVERLASSQPIPYAVTSAAGLASYRALG